MPERNPEEPLSGFGHRRGIGKTEKVGDVKRFALSPREKRAHRWWV